MSTMRSRSISLPAVMATTVVALVLGSLGTAVAGPALSKGAVKKIATKVVKKQAPDLHVASAATATSATSATSATNAVNATRLNGMAASAYTSPTFTFVLPVQPAAASLNVNFPGVPAGTYLASYSLLVSTLSSTQVVGCALADSITNPLLEGWSYQANTSTLASITATTLLTLGATAPRLYCNSPGNFAVATNGGAVTSRVTFVRVDAPTIGAVN